MFPMPRSARSSRRTPRSVIATAAAATVIAVAFGAVGCGGGDTVPVPDQEGAFKSTALVRADRRAYDGAPPTIPHESFGIDCSACHNVEGMPVSGVGFAPASPHDDTEQVGGTVRCRQCHVFVTDDESFVDSEYEPLRQDLRAGGRATAGAPPTIPHRILMRENCVACHDGPGAREEIRTTHPERTRCRQCHVPVTGLDAFESAHREGVTGETVQDEGETDG
jgi:nitrate reductase cytochrome c-type subunit